VVSRDQRLLELRAEWPQDAASAPVLLSLADAPSQSVQDLRHAWLGA
jgi:hypothetical protein